MDKEELKVLVEQRLVEIPGLRNARHGSTDFRRWERETSNMLRVVYGENSNHYMTFQRINFGAPSYPSTDEERQRGYIQGLHQAEPFLQALLFEIENFGVVTEQPGTTTAPSPPVDARLALEIKDAELRERCVDLLAAPDKYDRAVREACVILEHRVRTMIKAETSVLGVNLMTQAFRRESGALILADDSAEQEGAHQLYRGIVGFLKNPTSHRLVTSYSRNRAMEVIGFVDFLLDILQEAQRREVEPGEGGLDTGANVK